jgi:hypothetical protein
LAEALGRPVLRLPDLLKPRRENSDELEFAICFDAGPKTTRDQAYEQIKHLINAIFRSSPRAHTHINLFTTAGWLEMLWGMKPDTRIRIHDPAKAPTCAEVNKMVIEAQVKGRSPGQGFFVSPWSIWISHAMEGRSLDALHFICPGDNADAGPALRMSASPSPKEKVRTLSYMDATEVAALLIQTGAWAALFSPPPDDRPEATLALAADALAHAQPALVLYHPLMSSEQALVLCRAYAFLFSPDPTVAPLLRDGFLYCQPTSVAAYANLEIPSVCDSPQFNAPMIEKGANWLPGVKRQFEAVCLDQLRRRSPDVLLATPESARAQLEVADQATKNGEKEKTLVEIRKVVSNYLQQSRR